MTQQQHRLVVVSNRVAPPPSDHRPWPAGGLVSAVLPALEASGGLWFGWSGEEGECCDVPHRVKARNVEYATINLSRQQLDAYYEGFCNRVLWPLMHGLEQQACNQGGALFDSYVDVNRRFARALFPLLREGDLVWVHDYHLMLLAAELRSLGWKGRVGFFNHIPVPDHETWERIPASGRLADGLRDFDLVGVQTRRDARRLAEILGGIERIRAYPVSIDPDRFRELIEEGAESPLGPDDGRVRFFGVDRLDYTKGIPQRIEAFRRLVENEPALAERVRLVQVAAPSRTNIPEYQREAEAIDAVVRWTNERFPESQPITLQTDTAPPPAVAAALYEADVCVVTSVADGMNLVAKEFAAVHSAEHPGVLILSDSCGAAEELTDALIVDGADINSIAEAMRQALEMPDAEKRLRSARLREVVDAHTSADWFDDFVSDLAAIEPLSRSRRLRDASTRGEFLQVLAPDASPLPLPGRAYRLPQHERTRRPEGVTHRAVRRDDSDPLVARATLEERDAN